MIIAFDTCATDDGFVGTATSKSTGNELWRTDPKRSRTAAAEELATEQRKRRPSYPPSPPNSGGGSTGSSPQTEEVT